MTDYRTMFDREYLGAWDLLGRDVTVTIERVDAGTLTSQGGKTNKKPIIHFADKQLGFVANKTNCRTIAALYGNDVSKWTGKAITLYPTTTQVGPEVKECIRVRPVAPTAAKKGVADAAE